MLSKRMVMNRRLRFQSFTTVLVLALFGVIPAWVHSRSWGYAPTGGVGLILLVVVILLVLGRI